LDTDIFAAASSNNNNNNNNKSSLYNIYFDSNHGQVLKCKGLLVTLTARIAHLLAEWPDNPLLTQVLKIVKRIETFQLNDSLMKYLTGLELILEKSENWQTIAAQKYSLQAELKTNQRINHRMAQVGASLLAQLTRTRVL
jgi:midasin